MVIIPKILVLLFIDASHVKKSGHRQTLKNGTCGDRTHDLEDGTPSLSPIVPWKRKSWTFPYINYRSYLLWPYIPKVVRPVPIGIEWVPWWKKWKFFHFGKKFSTSKKFSRKKNFYSKITWIGTFCRGGNFSTLVENFPLSKSCKKKNFYSKITWIGSFCIEKFFPKNRKFFHFFQKLENSANLFIRAYSWTKFQRKIFSQKMGIQVVGFWAKNPNFQTWNWIFFQLSEKKSLFSKIRQIYILWPTCVPSFSKIKETFFLHHHSSSFIIHHHHHHHHD